jgi:hypothetical protein
MIVRYDHSLLLRETSLIQGIHAWTMLLDFSSSHEGPDTAMCDRKDSKIRLLPYAYIMPFFEAQFAPSAGLVFSSERATT